MRSTSGPDSPLGASITYRAGPLPWVIEPNEPIEPIAVRGQRRCLAYSRTGQLRFAARWGDRLSIQFGV
jgi:hypothetical protein